MIYFDSFSGGIAQLTKKKCKDKKAVLGALSRDPMVSTWDMEKGGLWRTIGDLVCDGYIDREMVDYPWLKYTVTEKGKRFLEEK